MRKIILGIIFICFFAACEEAVLKPYSGNDTVQFYSKDYSSKPSREFFWSEALNPEGEYDTCWITVQTVGHAFDVDRKLKIVQEIAVGIDSIYDMVGNVVDSIVYVVPNQAVAGKHFVPLDEPGLQNLMIMPAHAYQTNIPIVMKRDIDTRKKQTLLIRLVDTEAIKVGDPQFTGCTITIE